MPKNMMATNELADTLKRTASWYPLFWKRYKADGKRFTPSTIQSPIEEAGTINGKRFQYVARVALPAKQAKFIIENAGFNVQHTYQYVDDDVVKTWVFFMSGELAQPEPIKENA